MTDLVMSAIKWIPTCPDSWGVHTWQAPSLAYWRPGTWVPRLFGLQTNWCKEQWVMPGTDPNSVVKALSKCDTLKEQRTSADNPALKAADFHTLEARPDFFSCSFFTPRKRWEDVCEVKLSSKGNTVYAEAYSFSAGIVPASVLGSTILSVLLFPVPFLDYGQNKSHLRTLRGLVEDEGIAVEVQKKEVQKKEVQKKEDKAA
jgi:hypothetical protein